MGYPILSWLGGYGKHLRKVSFSFGVNEPHVYCSVSVHVETVQVAGSAEDSLVFLRHHLGEFIVNKRIHEVTCKSRS